MPNTLYLGTLWLGILPLSPRARRGGRGGTWVELPLVDSQGRQRKFAFHFISLGALEAALAANRVGGDVAGQRPPSG